MKKNKDASYFDFIEKETERQMMQIAIKEGLSMQEINDEMIAKCSY